VLFDGPGRIVRTELDLEPSPSMRDFWRDIDATSRVAKDRRGVFAYELIAERARSEMALRSPREVERELPIRINQLVREVSLRGSYGYEVTLPDEERKQADECLSLIDELSLALAGKGYVWPQKIRALYERVTNRLKARLHYI
jgi:hypothetical protein